MRKSRRPRSPSANNDSFDVRSQKRQPLFYLISLPRGLWPQLWICCRLGFGLGVVFGSSLRHHPCRLRVRQLAFVAPLVPLACLAVRPFTTFASVAAEPAGMPHVCHMLDTKHYTRPFSHPWDLAAMIRVGIGSLQRRRRRESKIPQTRTESNPEKGSRFRSVSQLVLPKRAQFT